MAGTIWALSRFGVTSSAQMSSSCYSTDAAHPVDVSSDATTTEGHICVAGRRGGFLKWLGRAGAGRAGRRGCGGDAGTPSATGFGGEVCCAFDSEAKP